MANKAFVKKLYYLIDKYYDVYRLFGNSLNYCNICNKRYLTTTKCMFLVIFEENPSKRKRKHIRKKKNIDYTCSIYSFVYGRYHLNDVFS